LHRLHNKTKRIAPYITLEDAIPDECIRKVFADLCKEFAVAVENVVKKNAIHLDSYATADFGLVGRKKYPNIPYEPWRCSWSQPDIEKDYLGQIQWMNDWIFWVKALPFAAAFKLKQREILNNQAIAILEEIGITALASPPPILSLRRVDAEIFMPSVIVEVKADVERARQALEQVLNKNHIPPEFLISVRYMGDLHEDEIARLSSAHAPNVAVIENSGSIRK